HQREAGAGHDGARRAQILDEGRLAERAVEQVAVALVLAQIAADPVDAALDAGALEQLGQLLMCGVRLVDEQVRSGLASRGEDLGPEDRRVQRWTPLPRLRPEERSAQGVRYAAA